MCWNDLSLVCRVHKLLRTNGPALEIESWGAAKQFCNQAALVQILPLPTSSGRTATSDALLLWFLWLLRASSVCKDALLLSYAQLRFHENRLRSGLCASSTPPLPQLHPSELRMKHQHACGLHQCLRCSEEGCKCRLTIFPPCGTTEPRKDAYTRPGHNLGLRRVLAIWL